MDVFSNLRWWTIKKYDTIWDKFSVNIKKRIDSEFVSNKKILKTKIKSHGHEVADFSMQNSYGGL